MDASGLFCIVLGIIIKKGAHSCLPIQNRMSHLPLFSLMSFSGLHLDGNHSMLKDINIPSLRRCNEMRTKHIALVVMAAALLPVAGAQASAVDTRSGKALFKAKCQACHTIEGDGNYRSSYHKQFRPKDFSKSGAWKGVTEEKIRFVLIRGQGVMRPVALSEEETRALIDYMMKDLQK